MGEHRNDLCQLAQSLVDIATGQVPHFKLTRLPNSAFAAFKGRQANVGAQAFGLAREVSAQHQQMLWATTVDCRDAPVAAEHAVVHAVFVDAARSMPMSSSLHPKRSTRELLDLSTDELWAERGEVVACPNDKATIKVAEQWAQEHEVEVWGKKAASSRGYNYGRRTRLSCRGHLTGDLAFLAPGRGSTPPTRATLPVEPDADNHCQRCYPSLHAMFHVALTVAVNLVIHTGVNG